MENNFLLTDDLLWDYADGFLEQTEKVRVDAYLRQHPEWQLRLDAIMAERKAFSNVPLDIPNAGFSDRVMAAWTVAQVQTRAAQPENDWIVRLIAGVFGLFIFVPLAMMGFAATGGNDTSVRWQYEMPSLPSVDWATLFSHPVVQYPVYLGITFLALRLLEKYVLYRRHTAGLSVLPHGKG